MARRLASPRLPAGTALALSALLAAGACGGGGNTHDGNPTGTMALLSFEQAGVNNAALNQVLEFRFSEAVDPQSLNPASLQLREGPSFGATVPGTFRTSGSRVFFEPQLPGKCDLSDGGFKAATQYRVTLVGYPEQFALRRDDGNPGTANGDPLKGTLNFEFRTRTVDDPLAFTDQISATAPVVVSSTPADTTACVKVEQGTNRIVIDVSENLRPCTVNANTVFAEEHQRGDPAVFLPDPLSGRNSGFSPVADSDPDKFSWGLLNGGETSVSPPQRVRCQIALVQDFNSTRITLTPEFGQFPDNALIVVQLTFGIQDFGGSALVPHVFAFTTENLPLQSGQYLLRFEGETPILKDQTTADVNTARSPLVAQGWMLFSGDADNGANLLQPTLPANNPPACNNPRQVNDGTKDDFDPTTDVVLDTGLTINTCPNKTDGSTAVVWEFRTFRIRAGRTVRISGVNPAIILVQGDVVIETGGRLQVRGDGIAGTPQGAGGNGTVATGAIATAGVGVAGAGSGGRAEAKILGVLTGTAQAGQSGFGSPSPQGTTAGHGAGLGGAHGSISTFIGQGSAVGGGGGGHSEIGMDGSNTRTATITYSSLAVPSGGLAYPSMSNRILTPSAGSGGGGGGTGTMSTFTGNGAGTGGGGGGGGGFVDVTSSGNISIFGIIDAAGGRGGAAAAGFDVGGGGGGGGSGGGIRLLTPFNLSITGGTLTTAGGLAGAGAVPTGGGVANPGGAGGRGRIALEDADSLITGLTGAVVVPAEGDPSNGFFRGIFDASRFQGGGLEPQAVTDIFQVGPTNPTFTVPVQADFIASIPTGADRGLNATSCLIEARGYQSLPDGSVDLVGGPTAWRTVGYLRHSGVGSLPTWVPNANPGDVTIPAGNGGPDITALNTREFLQVRVTFFLPASLGPFDPGPILDHWTLRFTFDQ